MVAKEANASLDALDGARLKRDLPGLDTAFDRTAMRGHLERVLIDEHSSARVSRCSLTSAILLDAECMVLRYELGIEDSEGQTSSVLVTARLYPDSRRATEYEKTRLAPLAGQVSKRAELALFTTPVAVLQPLAMAVSAFPIDGELPSLAAATDPVVAGQALEQLLTASGRRDLRVVGCRPEPVHYNRRHRCMLRYHLDLADGQRLVVYGKVADEGLGAGIPQVVEALRAKLASASIAVPECLGYREDLQLVAFTEIPGAPRVAQLLKARLRGEEPSEPLLTVEHAVEVCAESAAALHTSGLGLGPSRPLELELARLRSNLAPIRQLSPELARQLGHRLDQAEAFAAATPAQNPCQCHGDFSYTQLVFDGPHAGLVDFDNFCQAEPALDLGQFLAYLRYAGIKARGASAIDSARLSAQLAERFTASYTAAGGPVGALNRVAVYEVTNLIRMAEHAWQNLKARRLDQILTALDAQLSLDQ